MAIFGNQRFREIVLKNVEKMDLRRNNEARRRDLNFFEYILYSFNSRGEIFHRVDRLRRTRSLTSNKISQFAAVNVMRILSDQAVVRETRSILTRYCQAADRLDTIEELVGLCSENKVIANGNWKQKSF